MKQLKLVWQIDADNVTSAKRCLWNSAPRFSVAANTTKQRAVHVSRPLDYGSYYKSGMLTYDQNASKTPRCLYGCLSLDDAGCYLSSGVRCSSDNVGLWRVRVSCFVPLVCLNHTWTLLWKEWFTDKVRVSCLYHEKEVHLRGNAEATYWELLLNKPAFVSQTSWWQSSNSCWHVSLEYESDTTSLS